MLPRGQDLASWEQRMKVPRALELARVIRETPGLEFPGADHPEEVALSPKRPARKQKSARQEGCDFRPWGLNSFIRPNSARPGEFAGRIFGVDSFENRWHKIQLALGFPQRSIAGTNGYRDLCKKSGFYWRMIILWFDRD